MKKTNVSQFLRQYTSLATRQNYRIALKQFFTLMYPGGGDLDELSERYLREDRDYRDDLLRFRESMEGKAPRTLAAKFNAVRVYLSDNNIAIPKRLLKRLNGRTVTSISDETIPSNDQLKRICEYLPVHGKALALLLASSGMRIGEAIELRIDDLDLSRTPARIVVRGEVALKNKKRRLTFLTPEAVDAIKEWLNFRDQYLQQAKGRSAKYARDETYEGRLFPFSKSNFAEIWNRGLGKAGLLTKDPRTRRTTMRPHNLRKYFRLRVGKHGHDEVEALIGHQQGLDAIYADFHGAVDGEQRLEEAYLKAIPELSAIDANSHQIRAEATAQRNEFQTAISNLSLENEALKARVMSTEKALKATSHAFNNSVDKLTSRIRNLEHLVDELLNPTAEAVAPGPFTSPRKHEEEG